MSGGLILLVDDEASIVQLAQLYLEREGYRVQSVGDGLQALQAVRQSQPNLIVLDVMLPGIDGFEVCRRIRNDNRDLPILMLTARDEDIDKILGLELGADDYMTKPFNPRELVARVKAILRRSERTPSTLPTSEVIRLGDVVIDPGQRTVQAKNRMIDLRAQEFEVLLILVQHRNLVLTREQLLNLAWGFDFYGQTRTVDMHIAQLRRKLTSSKVKIETITGIGYKLVCE